MTKPKTIPAEVGQEVAERARQWIGTPFFHGGREKGIGCDCVGLLLGVASEVATCHQGAFMASLSVYDHREYSRIVNPSILRGELLRFLSPVAKDSIRAGDLLVFDYEGQAQHVAIFAGGEPATLIHSSDRIGAVAEHRFCEPMVSRLAYALRIRRRGKRGA